MGADGIGQPVGGAFAGPLLIIGAKALIRRVHGGKALVGGDLSSTGLMLPCGSTGRWPP